MNSADAMLAPSFDASLPGFARFASEHLGLRCPADRWADLARALQASSAALGFESLADCMGWLLDGPVDRSRIEFAARHLTNGETYFFRDPACLDVLQHHILPALVEERQASGPGERTLRIWCAGCATGEEPYTVAMMLERAVPDLDAWDIALLATDINPEFLAIASDGVYRDWSFRGVPENVRQQFFHARADGRLEIDPRVRRRVTFAHVNLAADTYPATDNGTYGMDVILCRNVLMYLEPACAGHVVRRLAAALCEGGWLVVAAAECSQSAFAAFETVRLPGATLYRKRRPSDKVEGRRPAVAPRPSPARGGPPPEMRPSHPPSDAGRAEELCDAAEALLKKGLHDEAAKAAEGSLAHAPGHARPLTLLSRIHANRGDLQQALRWSRQAIAANRIDAATHYAHATILMELGQGAEAAGALQRTVYLDPELALAHYWLGALAYGDAKPVHARRHLDNALAVLARRGPAESIAEVDGLSVASLIEIVRATRGRGGNGSPS